ncbi:MAG: amidohydrolase family protein [Acidobacteriota bacterium]
MATERRRARGFAAGALLSLLALPVRAGGESAGRPERPTLVIRAARMLDVTQGTIIRDAVVVVAGDRIAALGDAAAPPGARAIELGDVTLLPGLIDAHTHLTYDLQDDWIAQPVRESPPEQALRGARNARRTLLAGFTTVRDVGAYDFTDVALARAVEEGFIDGPRIVPSGHMIGITGGHCDITGFVPGVAETGPRDGIADGAAEILKAVRYQIKHGAQVIKTCATAGVMSFEESAGAQQYSDRELRAIVEEAARHGVRVAAHAHGTEGILAAVRAGVASIEHGSMLDDEAIALMKKTGTYLVPTVYTWRVPGEYPPLIRRKIEAMQVHVDGSVRAAIRAGVRIAFGTDAGTFPHGENAREFAVLVELGMTPIEAVRAATVRAADLLGVEDRGVIAPGRLADLIAVAGDPLGDVRVLEDVRFVMIGGRVVKRDAASGGGQR